MPANGPIRSACVMTPSNKTPLKVPGIQEEGGVPVGGASGYSQATTGPGAGAKCIWATVTLSRFATINL